MDRKLRGTIVLPSDTPAGECPRIFVEVRDVSIADAPSVTVASTELRNVSVGPGGLLNFELAVPEQDPGRSLSVRVHASRDGEASTERGDLVSTSSHPVATTGPIAAIRIPVRVVE